MRNSDKISYLKRLIETQKEALLEGDYYKAQKIAQKKEKIWRSVLSFSEQNLDICRYHKRDIVALLRQEEECIKMAEQEIKKVLQQVLDLQRDLSFLRRYKNKVQPRARFCDVKG